MITLCRNGENTSEEPVGNNGGAHLRGSDLYLGRGTVGVCIIGFLVGSVRVYIVTWVSWW